MNDNRHLQEELSSINSFELLSARIHLLKLTPESSGDLLFDFLQCQEGVIGGMKIMGRLLEEVASCEATRDEYGDAGTLSDLGKYLGGSAILLSALNNAVCELSAQTSKTNK